MNQHINILRNQSEHRIEVDGITMDLQIGTLAASKQKHVLAKLTKILGPVILPLASGADMKELLSNPNTVQQLVISLVNATEHVNDYLDIVGSFCENTRYSMEDNNGNFATMAKPGTFGANGYDSIFSGKLDLEAEWLKAHLSVNFKSFLSYMQRGLNAGAQT